MGVLIAKLSPFKVDTDSRFFIQLDHSIKFEMLLKHPHISSLTFN